ncbi:alpha/beta hydrolase [Sporobolomyces koalae]|uniref:alpha/beta hydrolase n=1 Tax=Sporobolomyces koalae TaxID=500713 RepID=UPI00317F0DD9
MVPLVATTRKGLISNASSATSTPRISLDEEESAGLLSSFHKRSGSGEDYPPPPSPPTLSLPFKNKTASRSSFTGRSFLALCACVFLVVLSVASYHQTKLRSQASLLDGERIRHSMHDEPVSRLNRTRFLFTDAIMGENYTVTAIVLHGLGQPSDEPPFVRKLANRVTPTADELNVTVRDNEPTSAWFNIETFDDLSQGENLDEFVYSQRQINQLVDEERDAMIALGKEPRVAIMGFSQGAVMTLLAVLTANETSRFEGGIALSGYVPLLDHIKSMASPASREIPLFWGHGQDDPYLTIEQAEFGSKLLRSDPVGLRKFEFKRYPRLHHFWNEDELDDVVTWFERTIPQHESLRSTLRTSTTSPVSPKPVVEVSDQIEIDRVEAWRLVDPIRRHA